MASSAGPLCGEDVSVDKGAGGIAEVRGRNGWKVRRWGRETWGQGDGKKVGEIEDGRQMNNEMMRPRESGEEIERKSDCLSLYCNKRSLPDADR